MCLETNFLKYSDTSITTLDMHNYAGLGAVDGNGRRQALSFTTEDDGIKCHVQHLYAYCSRNSLPTNEILIDPRFKYVTRGIAPNIENLGNGNWASDKEYASKLLNLLNQLLNKDINNMAGAGRSHGAIGRCGVGADQHNDNRRGTGRLQRSHCLAGARSVFHVARDD
jgi:hypothetical protein